MNKHPNQSTSFFPNFTDMVAASSFKYLLLVLLYLWQLMAAIFRSIYWFVLQRTSRISRLAYQLEQLNAREEELSSELARLNEQYLAKSAAIQARRSSVALERAKVLDELAETTKLKGGKGDNGSTTTTTTMTVKTIPVISCTADQNAVKSSKTALKKCSEEKKIKPKLTIEKPMSSPVLTNALQRSLSLTVGNGNAGGGRESPNVITRPISPFLAAKALIFERPRTPTVEHFTYAKQQFKPPSSPTSVTAAMEATLKRKEEQVLAAAVKQQQQQQSEQTNSSFSKLVGFNLATHRVNEYIDLILDTTLTEFRNCDREATSTSTSTNSSGGGSKRGERFRATIKELYGDPEWRPFINDLRQQYKIFCYL